MSAVIDWQATLRLCQEKGLSRYAFKRGLYAVVIVDKESGAFLYQCAAHNVPEVLRALNGGGASGELRPPSV